MDHEHSTYDEVVERHSEIVPKLYTGRSKCVTIGLTEN